MVVRRVPWSGGRLPRVSGVREIIVAAAMAVTSLAAWGPSARAQTFEEPYPVRLATIETGRLHQTGHGVVGLGDTRVALAGGRLELLTNTIADMIGVLNVGAKLALREARGDLPAVAIEARYYHSVGGPIDSGVRRIAESFANVTDSEVDVRGWVAHATASWPLVPGRTHAHLSAQAHRPIESRFAIVDSVAGGGGSVTFEDGGDVSTLVGIDHALIRTRLLVLAEAGFSWGLGEPRLGLALDAGSARWRVVLGALYPGVETDLATEPRDFVVSPVFSLHRRF